jgi:hypothetical protein
MGKVTASAETAIMPARLVVYLVLYLRRDRRRSLARLESRG